MNITTEVKEDIESLINSITIVTPSDVNGEPCECCASGDCCEYDCNAMMLTIGISNDGDSFSYQTGDNSYTGGAYGFPHWVVIYLTHDVESRQNAIAEFTSQIGNMEPHENV